jgi:hypothetical protein
MHRPRTRNRPESVGTRLARQRPPSAVCSDLIRYGPTLFVRFIGDPLDQIARLMSDFVHHCTVLGFATKMRKPRPPS